jgi:putative SOS response-associated peptidase YedK
MCGRFVQASPFHVIAETFSIQEGAAELHPRYNVSPGQDVLAVIRPAGDRANRLAWFRWGLVPSWSKDPSIGNRMINARAETVAEKPGFRTAFQKRRCLVAADGFYEWRRTGKAKSPFYVRLRTGEPMGLAGLYETWASPGGEILKTCTIITTRANALLETVHNRMPVIIPREKQTDWLDPDRQEAESLAGLLEPCPPGGMEMYEVSRAVNFPRNDSPELILPYTPKG